MAQPESDHEDVHEVADEPESDNEAISVEAQSDNEEVSGEPESDHEDVTAETEEDIQEQTGDGEPPGPPPQPHLPAGAYLGVLEASSGSSDGSGSDEEDRGPRRRRRQYSSVRLQRRRGRLEESPEPPEPSSHEAEAAAEAEQEAATTAQEASRSVLAGRRSIVILPQTADEDDFSFFPPGEGPEIKHEGTKERAKLALLEAYNEIQQAEEEGEKEPTCLEKFFQACSKKPKEPKEGEEDEEKKDDTELSPQMQKAGSQGTNMLKKVFFPAMPSVLQDLWVYLELIISLFAFAYGFVGYSAGVGTQRTFNILYLVLAIISTILALIDGFIYIFQLGSCARLFKYLCKKLKERRQRSQQEGDTEKLGSAGRGQEHEGNNKSCGCIPRMPEKWLTKFNQFFELARNVISELILYPLLICDLFDFVALGGSEPEKDQDRVNFALFCIGSFYLVLSVYIMRMVTIIGTLVSLMRLPLETSGGQKQYLTLMIRFLLNALGQIIVHLLSIIAVAAKIRNENPDSLDDEDPINITPFLWAVIFLGWFVPMAGVASFFVVNYYWTKEFSIGFWVDMISLLQGQGFAEAVFGGEGVSAADQLVEAEDTPIAMSQEAKDKTLDFVEKSGLKDVKKQLRQFKSPSFLIKFFHPLKLPLLSLTGLFYDFCLIAFAASMALSRENGEFRIVILEDNFLFAAFVIVGTAILIANFHLLIMINVGFSVMLFLSVVATIYIVVSLPFVILVYLPVASIIGYIQCFRSASRATNVFKVRGTRPQHKHLKLSKAEKRMINELYVDTLF